MNTVLTSPPAEPLPIHDPRPSMTAEEFYQKYPNHRVELVHGIVKELPVPDWLHGYICSEIAGHLREHVKKNDLGRIMGNDTFIKVGRNPDTVRGADVCYFSYARLPKGPIPRGILDIVPELVVEVHSPSDSWTETIAKVVEYLAAGVIAVVVVRPERQAVAVYRANGQEEHFTIDQELAIPDVLPGFVVPMRRFFE